MHTSYPECQIRRNYLPPKHLLYQQNRASHDVFERSQMQSEQCDQSAKTDKSHMRRIEEQTYIPLVSYIPLKSMDLQL